MPARILTKPQAAFSVAFMHAQERQFRGFSGVFVTPYCCSLFVPFIVKRLLQLITEFDNYIRLD